ncbi:IS30 family transposase (plasmid) [Paenibacillus urinalis]|uniref:IS30 family transposase n=1 Tax=Paenibacillus urinalis TaxID=521520 RepID=A0AAX3N8F0_9BACL|nr:MULTISPECIES: IS30 family transposase [Paenibacillus]MCM3131119.1 IS30 family transposase [Paenibacillus sp. MER 78]WDH85339.1 IS30 family transposase [Paenibacillus urinalis]WDH95221.1 IS30 family transposase [Paenibacillus urinalis]WDI05302.1 IS30 family transposase [Paenibacillus urinalis]
MSYSHLTIIERSKLEALKQLGMSARAIARELDRHHSTISRELKRNQSSDGYQAVASDERYQCLRQTQSSRGKWTETLGEEIEKRLHETWSPEQISMSYALKDKPMVSFKTIYRWLYKGRLARTTVQQLRHKGKRQKPQERRGRFLVGTSIKQRPKEIRSRETFGHWELDTVVSSRGKSKACVATFIERETRLYTAIKMPDRTALSMEIAVGVATAQHPLGTFQTATVDRGKEFACFHDLEDTHAMKVYFADPYSSWQRGSNENGNGLLREFFSKGKDFAEVSEDELEHALHLINNRPRKCLGWKTAHESFENEVSHLD